MRTLIGMFLALCGAPLWAGDAGGNGGYALHCKDTAGNESYELLDYHEAKSQTPALIPDLGTGTTAADKVQTVLSRIENFDAKRADVYRDRLDKFFEVDPLVAGPLGDTSDSGVSSIPPGCELKQLAVQRRPMFPGDRRYLIDRDIWFKLTVEAQAGLILHEIFYRDALDAGQTHSERARHFNGVVSAPSFEKYSTADYQKLVAWAFAAQSKVEFHQAGFRALVRERARFQIDLAPLLKSAGDGKIRWGIAGSVPAWITLQSSTLTGVAPAGHSRHDLRLVVQDSTSSAMAILEIEVR